MDLGQITITCKESAEIDQKLLKALTDHFKTYEEAGVSLTAEEFLNELIRAYLGKYVGALAEENIGSEDTEEEAMAKMMPLTPEVLECIMGNKAKATLLLRSLKQQSDEKVAKIERMFRMNPLEKILNGEANMALDIFKIVSAKTQA